MKFTKALAIVRCRQRDLVFDEVAAVSFVKGLYCFHREGPEGNMPQ